VTVNGRKRYTVLSHREKGMFCKLGSIGREAALVGFFEIDEILSSQFRPIPDRWGNFPISIVQVSGDSAECQVFGKQIDIMAASLRPISAAGHTPITDCKLAHYSQFISLTQKPN